LFCKVYTNAPLAGRALLMARAAIVLALLACSARICLAAPDDEEPPAEAPGVNQVFAINETNFDQWVFQSNGNAETARERIKSRLALQVAELERICDLSDAQKEKLSLAARGDVRRFFGQVEEVRAKFMKARNDQNAFGQIWQEIQPLQSKQAVGLFGDRSLFAKTLRNTLTAEQWEKYRTVLEERHRFRYRATIEVAIASLESSVALRREQRETLGHLLLDRTNPPLVFGRSDYWFVMHRLAGLKEIELKPLFDEQQWNKLRPQLLQANYRQMLIQNGVIATDDDNRPKTTDAATPDEKKQPEKKHDEKRQSEKDAKS
jgi:hypothetical protein